MNMASFTECYVKNGCLILGPHPHIGLSLQQFVERGRDISAVRNTPTFQSGFPAHQGKLFYSFPVRETQGI